MSTGGNWKDLLKASSEGNARLVEYHVRSGVDPNYQHPEYFSCPIFEAIRHGHQEIVKILIEQGKADPGVVEELTDQTTIEAALESGNFGIVDYLNGLLPEHSRHRFRNILVTEGHSGSGKAICKSLLSKGHRVAFTCPSQQDGDIAVKDLRAATSNHKVDYILAELESIRSVVDLVHSIQQKFSSLDVVIYNVRVQPAMSKQVNEDGLESTFFLQYMAPCVLAQRLGPLLEKNGPDSRVIILSDKTFQKGHPDMLKTPFGNDFHRRSTRFHTELCKVILFLNLSRRFENTQVRVMAVHPTVVSSDDWGCCGNLLMRILPHDPQNDENKIIAGPVWLAESPEAQNSHGKYYDGVQPLALPPSVKDLQVLNDWEQWTMDFLASAKCVRNLGD